MTKDTRRLNVLVVEDEPLIRWSIAETLAERGHAITEAADGATAMRTMKDTPEPFDVVLLDFRLPDSNDLSLLAHLQQRSPTSAFVMMTACGTPGLEDDAHDLGVSVFLNKPFDLSVVSRAVADAACRPAA